LVSGKLLLNAAKVWRESQREKNKNKNKLGTYKDKGTQVADCELVKAEASKTSLV